MGVIRDSIQTVRELQEATIKLNEKTIEQAQTRLAVYHKRELEHYIYVRKLEREIKSRDQHLDDLTEQVNELQNGHRHLEMASELSDSHDIIERMRLVLEDA